ncbi:NUDIX domain-containing protein, partial [Bordetella pertussis]
RELGLQAEAPVELAAFAHTFTHYRLHVRPWYLAVRGAALRQAATPERWVSPAELPATALPAPVRKLLDGLLAALPAPPRQA